MNRLAISPGAGLAYFFSGEYDFLSGMNKGSGDAQAYEADLFVQAAYLILPRASILVRPGIAYMVIAADGENGHPSWGDDFTEYFFDFYLAAGAQFEVTDRLGVALTYRFQVSELSGSTDYRLNGRDVTAESFSNKGFQIKMAYRF
jgi:opacity protein-like surface antigen